MLVSAVGTSLLVSLFSHSVSDDFEAVLVFLPDGTVFQLSDSLCRTTDSILLCLGSLTTSGMGELGLRFLLE